MKKKKFYFPYFFGYFVFFIAAFFLLPASESLAKEMSACLSGQWPHEKSDLPPAPDLVFGKLPNGFRYVLMENHEPRDRVSLHLNVQAGSLHEKDDQRGLAHYLEHMLFNGSEHFAPGELVKYFQSIGMAFGADANAHTGYAETVYDVLLPTGGKESLEKGLLVIRDYARGALLLESEIERERGIILAEKRTRDSAGYRTHVASMNFLFSGTLLPQRMPIGTEAVIKSANRSLLKDYYDAWYRPENMILVMVGDFDTPLAVSLIKERFETLEPGAPPSACPDMGTVRHKGIKPFYHFEEEAGHANVAIQVIWNTLPKPDSLAFQKELLTQYLADSIINHRLEAITEKPDAPFTDTVAYSWVFLNQLGSAKIGARSAPENWEKTLSVLEHTLRQALKFGFAPSELDRVRKEFLADLDAAILEKDTRDSDELSRSIIESLNDDKVFLSPDQDKELYAPYVQSLTLQQANDAFAKVWNHDHRLVLVTGNAKIGNKDKTPESLILATFEASAKTAVTALVQDKALRFPYLPEPEEQGGVKKEAEISDLGIGQLDFENGVRLNLKRTDFKKNEVIAAISFGFGQKSEPTPGLAMLAESVLNQSGLGGLSKEELDRALAGKNTHVRFRVKEDSFMLRGETVSKEVPLLFQLLYAYLRDPGYREDAHALVMKRFEQMYEKLVHTIDGAMDLSGEGFLAGGDSRFGIPPHDALKKLTLEQIRSWIDTARNSPLEISVVGDFDPESVKSLASQYFGSLPHQKKIPQKAESLNFPEGKALDLRVDTKIRKGMAVVAWPTTDYSDIQRVRRLSILGHVLNDRLREEIREKLGATYSQYAYNDSSRAYAGYGVLRSVLLTDPEMSDTVIKAVRQIASDLVRDGVKDEEFQRAIEPVLTGIKDMRRTNRYWLETVLDLSTRSSRQLDWCRSIQADYAAITAQEISALAKIYLDNKKAATIVIRPANGDPASLPNSGQ